MRNIIFDHVHDITFEGSNDDFVWKSPHTDFDTGTKVTVHESQEALFYHNGECVGVLGAGSHVLELESHPFLKRMGQAILGIPFMFHAEIYFVNKVNLDIKWGVGDILYEDPKGPVFEIGCFGQMDLKAMDARVIVEKLVGTQSSLTRTQVLNRFKEYLISEVTDKLVNTMLDNNISITQFSRKLRSVSEIMRPDIAALYGRYGFSLEEFSISGANIPTDNPEYKRLLRIQADKGLQMDELQLERQRELIRHETEAIKFKMDADAMAYKRQVEGYDYATERHYDFLDKVASSENTATGIGSEMLQMGAGLGMMGAVSGAMQGLTNQGIYGMSAGVQQPYGQPMRAGQNPYGQPMQAGQNPYGQPIQNPVQNQQAAVPVQEDPMEVLGKLKKLLDAGLIEQAEYDAKKQEVLSRM